MADDEKELKDQRVVTMMSPSELEAIDDWMFKSRIRSRGEAIRRLCQMGMIADNHLSRSGKVTFGGEKLDALETESLRQMALGTSTPESAMAATRLRAFYAEYQVAMIDSLLRLAIEMHPLRTEKDAAEALEQARRLKAELDAIDPSSDDGPTKLLTIARSLHILPFEV